MNVDQDVLLQARELERRNNEVLLFILVDVNPTVSCQYTEGERCGRKHQGRRDLPASVPVAENARHGALRYRDVITSRQAAARTCEFCDPSKGGS